MVAEVYLEIAEPAILGRKMPQRHLCTERSWGSWAFSQPFLIQRWATRHRVAAHDRAQGAPAHSEPWPPKGPGAADPAPLPPLCARQPPRPTPWAAGAEHLRLALLFPFGIYRFMLFFLPLKVFCCCCRCFFAINRAQA